MLVRAMIVLGVFCSPTLAGLRIERVLSRGPSVRIEASVKGGQGGMSGLRCAVGAGAQPVSAAALRRGGRRAGGAG